VIQKAVKDLLQANLIVFAVSLKQIKYIL